MKLKLLLLSIGIILFPSIGHAADLTSLTDHLRDQMDSAKIFALALSYMFGLIIFIFGLLELYKESKQPNQDHMKKGMIAIGVGTLLLMVPIVIGISGGTFGDDENAVTSIYYDTVY